MTATGRPGPASSSICPSSSKRPCTPDTCTLIPHTAQLCPKYRHPCRASIPKFIVRHPDRCPRRHLDPRLDRECIRVLPELPDLLQTEQQGSFPFPLGSAHLCLHPTLQVINSDQRLRPYIICMMPVGRQCQHPLQRQVVDQQTQFPPVTRRNRGLPGPCHDTIQHRE